MLFRFLHIFKAKSGFNDQYSVPWYFLSSKGHVIVRYYVSKGLFFRPQQTFLSGRFGEALQFLLLLESDNLGSTCVHAPQGHSISKSYSS